LAFWGRFGLSRKQFFSALIIAALFLAAAASALLLPSTASAQARLTLEGVLHELDQASHGFHSLSADIERDKYTAVVKDTSTETGTILVHDDKMLLEMKSPDPRTILRNKDSLFVYTPGLHRVEEYNLSQHRALVDQYLMLGFGMSGHELTKSYDVTLLGEPMMDQRKTAQLELTPKSSEARQQISKIQIWLDESSWLPVQQQFFETGSGDYFTVKFTRMMKNPKIPDSSFKRDWPKGTETVKPQG
jgi:outer membrane lipoprotein-sorting protein